MKATAASLCSCLGANDRITVTTAASAFLVSTPVFGVHFAFFMPRKNQSDITFSHFLLFGKSSGMSFIFGMISSALSPPKTWSTMVTSGIISISVPLPLEDPQAVMNPIPDRDLDLFHHLPGLFDLRIIAGAALSDLPDVGPRIALVTVEDLHVVHARPDNQERPLMDVLPSEDLLVADRLNLEERSDRERI